MPAINATIVVDQTNLTITPTTTNLGVTVEPINLGIFTTSPTPVGGSIGQLQYNATGVGLGGVANTSVANGNITFTNLANLKIDGGTNAYYLQTDGAGGLTWAAGGTPTGSGVPSGANTQIQLSDGSGSFASGAGFTFDNASNVFSTPGNINTTGIFNGDGGGLSNIELSQIANGTSNVDISQVDGNIEFAVGGANIVRMSTTGAPYPALVKIEGNVTTEGDITINPGAIFIGDGGGLSNLNVTAGSQITNGTSNVDIVSVDGNVVVGVNGVADRLIVTDIGLVGDGYGLSNIAASNIVGLSLSSISNGTSNINISASGPEEIEFVVGGADVGSFVNTGASPYPGFFTVNGNVLAYRDIETVTGSLIGNGNGISNIQGANVSGEVSFAATANAVAGANVSGSVANAVYADTAGSATTATTAQTVTSAAQPNITSVGIMAGLGIQGNLQFYGGGNIIDVNTLTFASTISGAGDIFAKEIHAQTYGTVGGFYGDGRGISNIAGANISGAVALANTAGFANGVMASNVSYVGGAFDYIAQDSTVPATNPFGALGTSSYVWEIANKTFVDTTDFPLLSNFHVTIWFPNYYIGSGQPLQIGQWMELTMLTKNTGTNTFTLNPNWTIRAAGTVNEYYYPANPTGNGYSGVQEWTWKVQRIADVGLNAAYNAIVTYKNLVT